MNKIVKNTDIYRFEINGKEKLNFGVYTGFNKYHYEDVYDKFEKMCIKHSNSKKYPTILDDLNKDLFDLSFFCACPSLDKLLTWFEGYVNFLLENGFVIKKYKVKKTYIGYSEKQCFFKENDILNSEIIQL